MPRYRLDIEYDGRAFSGWQAQANAVSVQSTIEAAIQALTGGDVRVYGAGRTDAGVHATGQVAHIDLQRSWAPRRLREGINALLRPHPISVIDVSEAQPNFDARFSAIGRTYRYIILNRLSPPALDFGLVWHVKRSLDEDAMDRAARHLIGHHDFTTFRNVDCQAKSPVKTLRHLSVHRLGERVIFDVEARSFLHNQVRSMVGSLKRVGEGMKPEAWIAEILAARSRPLCGALAPAEGLYLVAVTYPENLEASQEITQTSNDEAEDQV